MGKVKKVDSKIVQLEKQIERFKEFAIDRIAAMEKRLEEVDWAFRKLDTEKKEIEDALCDLEKIVFNLQHPPKSEVN